MGEESSCEHVKLNMARPVLESGAWSGVVAERWPYTQRVKTLLCNFILGIRLIQILQNRKEKLETELVYAYDLYGAYACGILAHYVSRFVCQCRCVEYFSFRTDATASHITER